MDVEVNHYVILGLPSGVEGAKLSDKDIKKAYRSKALELHPDKRRDDPNAEENFTKLQKSYEILKDEKSRKVFDDQLRVKHEKIQRQSQQDSKRRRMMSDLEERERSAFFGSNPSREARLEEERIARKLREEIETIRAMHARKTVNTPSSFQKETTRKESASGSGSESSLDKGKVLKVSWEKVGEDYSAQRLRELFEQFGEVEDVVIKSSKKKRWALVVMASKEATVAATGTMCGDLSNPLLVLPLQPAAAFPTARDPVKPNEPELRSNLVGAGYQAFEDSVLKKLQKAAERQK